MQGAFLCAKMSELAPYAGLKLTRVGKDDVTTKMIFMKRQRKTFINFFASDVGQQYNSCHTHISHAAIAVSKGRK